MSIHVQPVTMQENMGKIKAGSMQLLAHLIFITQQDNQSKPLALTYCFHKNNIISSSFTEQNGFICGPCDTSQCPTGWRWPDVRIHVS